MLEIISLIKMPFDNLSDFYDALQKMRDPLTPVPEEGRREMADTIGSLCDKLSIVTTRMWHAQDTLYEIRRMSKEQFIQRYGERPDEVYDILKRATDMNIQRNQLMDEIDLFMKDAVTGKIPLDQLTALKHKMY